MVNVPPAGEFGCIAATATTTNKSENQDAHAYARAKAAGLTAVIVTDGLGSHAGAEVAASLAAKEMRRRLMEMRSADAVSMPSLFDDARVAIRDHVNRNRASLPESLNEDNGFGTTAICAIDLPDRIVMGYAGNGGLFHIRGNFNTYPKSQLLPWTSINYLNPHSISKDGKNNLYRLLSPFKEDCAPTVISLDKDRTGAGDIIMICSDGVYSYDQVPVGMDGDEQIWISAERSMTLFYRYLAEFFAAGEFSDQALESVLQRYLSEMKKSGLVSDDCTLGVLVSAQAQRYQNQRNEPLGLKYGKAD